MSAPGSSPATVVVGPNRVFSATMMADREQLGEKVTAWITSHPQVKITDITVTQSSDEAFHCIAMARLDPFSAKKQLLRMGGVNLRERKSGKYVGQTKIARTGRPLYRAIINQMALAVVRLTDAATEGRVLAALAGGGHPGAASSMLKVISTELSQTLTELAMEAAGPHGRAYQPHAAGARGHGMGYVIVGKSGLREAPNLEL